MSQAGSKLSRTLKEQWQAWTVVKGQWRKWKFSKDKAEPSATAKAIMHAEKEWVNPNYELDSEVLEGIIEMLGCKIPNRILCASENFQESWCESMVLCSMQFGHAKRVILKIMNDESEAIVIAPHWEQRTWYKDFFKVAKKAIRYLEGVCIFAKSPPTRSEVEIFFIDGSVVIPEEGLNIKQATFSSVLESRKPSNNKIERPLSSSQ